MTDNVIHRNRFIKERFMKIIKQLIAGAAMGAIGAMASAQPVITAGNEAPLTRAQVRAETAAAIAAGRMLPAGEAPNYPFPPHEAASTRSRAAVAIEAAAAVAAGEIPHGELSLADMQREPVTSEKSRVQVRAETREARRLGLLLPAGELTSPQVTLAQSEAIRAAGLRARGEGSTLAAR
jgi:hypothetical protein